LHIRTPPYIHVACTLAAGPHTTPLALRQLDRPLATSNSHTAVHATPTQHYPPILRMVIVSSSRRVHSSSPTTRDVTRHLASVTTSSQEIRPMHTARILQGEFTRCRACGPSSAPCVPHAIPDIYTHAHTHPGKTRHMCNVCACLTGRGVYIIHTIHDTHRTQFPVYIHGPLHACTDREGCPYTHTQPYLIRHIYTCVLCVSDNGCLYPRPFLYDFSYVYRAYCAESAVQFSTVSHHVARSRSRRDTRRARRPWWRDLSLPTPSL
jgi:hypothetical protein